MIWEYRAYDVAHGRLGEEVDRMRRVAIEPAESGSSASMFDAYGIPHPFSAWHAIAGDGLPAFGYLVQWTSLAARQAAFPPFWADPRWHAIKQESDDGRPMVERIDCWVVQPAPGSAPPRAGSGRPGAVQELRWVKLANGNLPDARQALEDTITGPLAQAGADPLSVFDLVIGPRMASSLVFVEWPSLEACEAGNAAIRIPRSPGASVMAHAVLAPVHFTAPNGGFGS